MREANANHRLLLIEDDGPLGAGLRTGLEQAGYLVDWVQDNEGAAHALLDASYDVVLLDVQLPDGSGLELLSELRRNGNDVLVLIITARDRVDERVDGLDIGADDYLVKPFEVKELLARVRALLRRRYGASDLRLEHGDISVQPSAHTVHQGGHPVELPHREFSLLVLLLEHRGRVVTRRLIEASLYPMGHEVESNTVEVYVHKLRKRLGTDLIRTVRGVGYMIEDSRSSSDEH